MLARLTPVSTGEAATDYFLFPIKPHLELACRWVRITHDIPSTFYLSRLRTFRVHRFTLVTAAAPVPQLDCRSTASNQSLAVDCSTHVHSRTFFFPSTFHFGHCLNRLQVTGSTPSRGRFAVPFSSKIYQVLYFAYLSRQNPKPAFLSVCILLLQRPLPALPLLPQASRGFSTACPPTRPRQRFPTLERPDCYLDNRSSPDCPSANGFLILVVPLCPCVWHRAPDEAGLSDPTIS